jgi:hypothetical protein
MDKAHAEHVAHVEASRPPRPPTSLLCKQCGGTCEPSRQKWATPICFKCIAPAAPSSRRKT